MYFEAITNNNQITVKYGFRPANPLHFHKPRYLAFFQQIWTESSLIWQFKFHFHSCVYDIKGSLNRPKFV